MESSLEADETKAQCIVTAAKSEVKRRWRKQSKD
ncbi:MULTISPECIES: hypothetical protein [Pectobacterium]|nr:MULTISPECIES: hypothetical protein [Pectobacterium]